MYIWGFGYDFANYRFAQAKEKTKINKDKQKNLNVTPVKKYVRKKKTGLV